MATHRVGGEVDAFCTRCKMSLAHTILAMVGTRIARVRCNTCGGDHAFRREPGSEAPRTSAGRTSAPRERAEKVVSAGRAPCPLCAEPLDPAGHVCIRLNGYHRRATLAD